MRKQALKNAVRTARMHPILQNAKNIGSEAPVRRILAAQAKKAYTARCEEGADYIETMRKSTGRRSMSTPRGLLEKRPNTDLGENYHLYNEEHSAQYSGKESGVVKCTRTEFMTSPKSIQSAAKLWLGNERLLDVDSRINKTSRTKRVEKHHDIKKKEKSGVECLEDTFKNYRIDGCNRTRLSKHCSRPDAIEKPITKKPDTNIKSSLSVYKCGTPERNNRYRTNRSGVHVETAASRKKSDRMENYNHAAYSTKVKSIYPVYNSEPSEAQHNKRVMTHKTTYQIVHKYTNTKKQFDYEKMQRLTRRIKMESKHAKPESNVEMIGKTHKKVYDDEIWFQREMPD